MNGEFQFDADVTVIRVISTLEYGAIFAGETSTGEQVRVRYMGRSAMPLPGDTFNVQGQWGVYIDRFRRQHRQVETKRMKRRAVLGDLLGPFLCRVPNIGPRRANRLLQRYGHGLFEALSDPSRIAEVAGVMEPNRPSLAARISAQLFAAMAEKGAADRIKLTEVQFLTELERLGLRDAQVASRLWRLCAGADALDRLRAHPYLAAHLTGWTVADRIGKTLLRETNSVDEIERHPARMLGALSNVWREVLAEGNSACSEPELRDLLAKRKVDPNLVLAHAESQGRLCRKGALLRAPGAAWLEDEVARMLSAIETRTGAVQLPVDHELERIIRDGEHACELMLTEEQRSALLKLINLPVGVLQGSAGVGKTTVMKVLAYARERCGGNVVFGALAGKAALQLARGASSRGTVRRAFTLARLIRMLQRQADDDVCEADSAETVEFNERSLLVIDEAGMLDTSTLHQLLDLLPEGVRILMAGDDGQLFPVGFGRIYHDLVADGRRVATLTRVLRQADGSAIPVIAAEIRQGHVPKLKSWQGEPHGVYSITSAQFDQLDRGEDHLVIAARRRTCEEINQLECDKRRNEHTRTHRLGPNATVAVGDPVMVSRNHYQHALCNGLLGVVREVGGDRIVVQWDGDSRAVELPEAAEIDVVLAYGITCHKAQGSSAATVVIDANDSMVTREWLYTAVTRGRELVLLLNASVEALAKAISRRSQRTSAFNLSPYFPLPNPTFQVATRCFGEPTDRVARAGPTGPGRARPRQQPG
jgi:exodeoxyribonuclease V alpha subunit